MELTGSILPGGGNIQYRNSGQEEQNLCEKSQPWNTICSKNMIKISYGTSSESTLMQRNSKYLNGGVITPKKQVFNEMSNKFNFALPRPCSSCQENVDLIDDNQMFCDFCAMRYNRKVYFSSYAGARFHKPPKPDALPKPPVHWVHTSSSAAINHVFNTSHLDTITVHLKGLLKVQV